MGKDEKLALAKRSYRTAKAEGNREEEARWANVVGDILKNRGEYVEALKWLRLDYEVSVNYLPEKQLLPTCQSLGELYLRLHQFKDALIYQKMHLELAKDANDLVEQQRASTQLGRTYHEMLVRSDDDHYSVRNAKKYFRLAMKFAQSLKENPPTNRCLFIKEYVDAHNNIGMLEKDRDNFEEAEMFLTKGLEICDEEEIGENDDSRSRLHHNLGSVYLELRVWDKAMEHIEKDILICKRIGHIQGEAKGYINLGELHYRVQKYEDAIRCYKRALDLAKSMEDEDALVEQIGQNIETVQTAMNVLDEMKKEEQILKKLARNMETARGTPSERRYLLQHNASLDRLIEKSSMIFSWLKHREFAKMKKRIVSQLCDKEKLGDSFLVLGESYQKLRNFKKSLKWFQKGLELYKSIGNLEGQALAKINIGDALDSDGDWNGALHAFEDGYRFAVDAKCLSIQLAALENMHYSNMIRFDNIEEARRLHLEIDKLKQLKDEEFELPGGCKNQCSETDSDGDDCLSDRRSNEPSTPEISKSISRSKFLGPSEKMNDDVPLVSLLRSHKHFSRQKTVPVNHCNLNMKENGNSLEQVMKEISAQKKAVGRKRIRLVLSDDEGETQDEVNFPKARHHKRLDDDITIIHENRRETDPPSSSCRPEDNKAPPSKCVTCSLSPHNVEESSSSYQSLKPSAASQTDLRSSNNDLPSDFAICGCKSDVGVSENAAFRDNVANINLQNSDSTGQCLTFMIDNDPIHVEAGPGFAIDKFSTESFKAELACLYYMHLPMARRSKGLLPIIQDMKSGGKFIDFEAFDTLKELPERLPIDVSTVWVQKRLMKLYIDCCEELFEQPNLKLLKKLYISEVEDVVSASDCELQDVSITPLLNALRTQNSIAILDLSHNLLGNGTVEKLQKLFTSGIQYGGLTLDLHCNRLGSTALFQICECPVLFTRLEVLNISGNRLNDTCGSFLSNILEKCKALVSLNIEHCSITSRTIQKVADSLSPESVLAQLWIGNNTPVSGTTIINLLEKLATLRRFTELSLTNLKLNKGVMNSLCQLLKTSCMSCLMLGSTYIGADGAMQLTKSLLSGSQESVKLDFSCCAITSMYISELNNNVASVGGIVELNLEGNPLRQEGGSALVSILTNPQSALKILVLNKCQLGLSGILQVIIALKENGHLEELYLAENGDLEERHKLQHDQRGRSGALHTNFDMSETPKTCELRDFGTESVCVVNTSCNLLEVADSEDDAIRGEAAPSELDDSCTSSCQKHQLSSCQLLEELSTAICMAKQLQLLDLSSNGFSSQDAEILYSAWSSNSARASALLHSTSDSVHLSTETNRCCRGRPCCRKD